DGILSLPLGTNEQHAPAARNRVRYGLQGLMQQRYRLGKIDDVNVVTGAKNIGRHFRVPAMRLVAEMRPRLEEAAHGEVGQCHFVFSPVKAAAELLDLSSSRREATGKGPCGRARAFRVWNAEAYKPREAAKQGCRLR